MHTAEHPHVLDYEPITWPQGFWAELSRHCDEFFQRHAIAAERAAAAFFRADRPKTAEPQPNAAQEPYVANLNLPLL